MFEPERVRCLKTKAKISKMVVILAYSKETRGFL